MNRYFFHLRNGTDETLDLEGVKLEGDALVSRVLMEARAIISHDALAGCICLGQHIDAEDQDGHVVHRLDFVDALEIVGDTHP